MDDIPNINPVKPLWPKRPEEKNPQQRRKQDDEARDDNKDDDTSRKPDSDHDGQIDEYV